MKYIVKIAEVHYSYREVKASSPEEAKVLALESEEFDNGFAYTREQEYWIVEESGPSESVLQRLIASDIDLEEMVIDEFSEQACAVNNRGRCAQAEYVLDQWGEEAVISYLDENHPEG